MSRDWCRELGEVIEAAGLTVKVGLRAQGHLPKVNWMLAHGATWYEIGRVIGWNAEAAKDWYETYEVTPR